MAVTAIGLAVAAAPAYAGGNPIVEARCPTDSIEPAVAVRRLEWARACGDRINVVSPSNPDRSYPTGATSSNGLPFMNYIESDGSGANSYSGANGDINSTFTQMQWRPHVFSASTAALGFQKWTGQPVLALPRPMYPSFVDSTDFINGNSLYPNPSYDPSDCNLYRDAAGTQRFFGTFYVAVYCTSSCYTPEQQIAFEGGDEGILDALNEGRSRMITLTAKATLDHIETHADGVASYTRDFKPATQVIFVITTKSGGELRVTDKHPVLIDDGRMVQASTIKVGQHLIKADGSLDEVVAAKQTTYEGKVYNIKPVSTNRVSNILIAQGFLVGSSRFQNDDVDFINRIVLSHGMPTDVIPR